MLAWRHPLEGHYEIFFFFSFYHIGGAEKVHASIAKALRHEKGIIFFTRTSHNDLFLEDFKASGHRIIDISRFTDNKWMYWKNIIYRGLISGYINSQPGKKIVFNGQSNFGYKLSRWINRDIPQIELIHSLSNFSYIRIPFLPFYRSTIMISKNRIDDHMALYKRYGIPEKYPDKIEYIINGISLPDNPVPRQFTGKELSLLYVGRDTPEKRVHLVRDIAGASRKAGLPVTLTYTGDVSSVIPKTDEARFYGNVGVEKQMDEIYRASDVLLITSSEEGFPMVVMEAMARGCIILATPVGDIPLHIQSGINGFLLSQVSNEPMIVEDAVKIIKKMLADPDLCAFISAMNIKYAAEHFGLVTFEKNYQELFDNYLY